MSRASGPGPASAPAAAPAPSRGVVTVLAIVSALELASLAVLLINMATVHARVVTQLTGPIHGALYLTAVVIALLAPGFRLRERLLGLVPVVGGALAVARVLRRRGRTA